ncbi:MAG: hypothetical protein EAZ87_00835 [Nostocales cyanobacterium]|nr:MAG: hypothetical protein EAZ87_00835 [Nostocales cyanobacterium]
MNEKIQNELEDELKEEYDLSQLKNPVRGKYHQKYKSGYSVTIHHEDGTTTVENFPKQDDVIVLDPDVKQYFPNSEAVNSTLRSLIKLIPQKS